MDGQQGLLFAEKYQPDLILMDIKMPILSGYEAVNFLKANPNTQHIPVMALTATAVGEHSKVEAQLFARFLPKPIHISELLKEISYYLKYTPLATIENINQSEVPLATVDDEINRLGELVEKLETYLPEWQEIHDGLDLERIGDFSKQIQLLGEEYHFPSLFRYGEHLNEYVQLFKIEQIEKTLNQFPEIVTTLKLKVQ